MSFNSWTEEFQALHISFVLSQVESRTIVTLAPERQEKSFQTKVPVQQVQQAQQVKQQQQQQVKQQQQQQQVPPVQRQIINNNQAKAQPAQPGNDVNCIF